jgi:ArsR family metal-binding transcriptional regulator
MTLIHVPRPPKNAMNPNRPVSALLKTQIEHLHEAERRLPLRYRSKIYVNAIKTEAEAAAYISSVTEAIRKAHAEAERARRAPRRKQVVEIAAAAAKPGRKRVQKAAKKSGRAKRRRKK